MKKFSLISAIASIAVLLGLAIYIGKQFNNTNADKAMFDQINIGDFYQIKCICLSSCDDHHIVQISNKRKQDITNKYLVDIRVIDPIDANKYIDFTYDIGTFMSVFEPVKIYMND